mmetsp:Transcript_55245/g.152987  ORF Transcript_55245/g.152987 Transcript_55245/m.152987 type:complete len:256 (+) Transcript_55245:44-811(+)
MVRITHCGRQPRAQTNTFELSAPTSRSQSPTRPIMRDRAAVMSGVSRSGAGGLRSLWWAPLGRLIEMMPRSGAKSRNTPPTLQPSLSPLVNTIRDAWDRKSSKLKPHKSTNACGWGRTPKRRSQWLVNHSMVHGRSGNICVGEPKPMCSTSKLQVWRSHICPSLALPQPDQSPHLAVAFGPEGSCAAKSKHVLPPSTGAIPHLHPWRPPHRHVVEACVSLTSNARIASSGASPPCRAAATKLAHVWCSREELSGG